MLLAIDQAVRPLSPGTGSCTSEHFLRCLHGTRHPERLFTDKELLSACCSADTFPGASTRPVLALALVSAG